MKAPELIIIGLDGAVDSFAAQEAAAGNLPNFARLMKRGCRLVDMRPVHPTITPVCWAALQTGATPEINGVIADKLYQGGHISKLVSGYNGTHLKAERLWEAAARAGKTSIVDSMPVTGPRRSDLVWQMEGTSCNPGRMIMPDGSAEIVDIPQQVWFFGKDKKPVDSLKDVAVSPSPVRETEGGSFILEPEFGSTYANRNRFLPFVWNLKADSDGFVLSWENAEIRLIPGEWTEPFNRNLQTENGCLDLVFRFICLELEDGFLIFSSAACHILDRVWPAEFAKALHNMPPTPVHKEYVFFANPNTNKLAMDSWDFHMDWHIEMFKRVLAEKMPEIIVTYMGDIDTVNHFYWPELARAKSTNEQQYAHVEQCFRRIYQTADRCIGYFLDEVADENTTILIVSDHGSIGVKEERDINNALEKAGLLVRMENSRQIDWSKTRAAYRGCGHIFVNLEERGGGIVPASEYESTVDEIITTLQNNLRGPAGDSYLAFAVRGREAGFFGLGGEFCGDVVFGLTAGYAAMTVHAEQIPTATNEFGSMRALCWLSGPGIPGGTVWDKPVNSIDLAPTLCAKMGVPLPAQSNGRVIREFAQNE